MGGISLDINTTVWERAINATLGRIIPLFNAAVYKSADALLNRIKELTPVGNPDLWNPPYWPKNYKPGTLKASWEMHIENDAITISNPQPYAYRIEYGWSTQAPEGMMRRAVLQYPDMIKRYYSSSVKL